ncbi:MAG: DASS family sodium-coupled anion symporter [Deltaproteobacteria bacterium]|nr:DASS family sodium-coupled anion symporter [Deltaproteobacteria bacterium]
MRNRIGLFLGPVVFVVLYFLPFPSLTTEAHRLLAVIGFVLIWWLTEAVPIPVTALMGAVLNVLIGVAPTKAVFAPFAHPLVFLFIGSFILAEAITRHGLDRRFSFAILSIKFLEKSPLRVLFAFGAISAVASMWISNTAATAMMLPIGIGILSAIAKLEDSSKESGFDIKKYGTAVMLMIAYGASVGGIATPIGTPPNVIGIGMIDTLAGIKISFFEWMSFALPITAVMFVYLFFVLGVVGGSARGTFTSVAAHVREEKAKLGSWNRGEKNTALAFIVAVMLWVLPSVVGLVLGKHHETSVFISSRLHPGVVALIAACILFILPISKKDRTFTMDWKGAVRIDWGTILLFGGGLSLGALMFSTGLADSLGGSLTGLTGATGLWSITAVGVFLGIVLSETTSNTASANMVIPVMIAIAHGMGVSPLPPALGACLGASFGFMLPVSTPPNAIVYGSGMVPITTMFRKGIFFDIGGFFIIMLGLYILCNLFGWT